MILMHMNPHATKKAKSQFADLMGRCTEYTGRSAALFLLTQHIVCTIVSKYGHFVVFCEGKT